MQETVTGQHMASPFAVCDINAEPSFYLPRLMNTKLGVSYLRTVTNSEHGDRD